MLYWSPYHFTTIKNMDRNLCDHKTLGVKDFFRFDFSLWLIIDIELIKQHKYIDKEYLLSNSININAT